MNGRTRVEKDLTRPELRALVEQSPECIRGYTETDESNFSFRHPPCSFYSGTKGLAEEAIKGIRRLVGWEMEVAPHLKKISLPSYEEKMMIRLFDPQGFYTRG